MASQERRRFSRIEDHGLSFSLNAGGYDTISHTLNLSESGIYCKIDKEIPLMSRVRLKLMFPNQARREDHPDGLDVDGVVVREHPVIIDGQTKHYDIAIFFDSLSDRDRDIISNYISWKIGSKA